MAQHRDALSLDRGIGGQDAELLISIGARASIGPGEEMWGLADRVGTSGIRV
jgi:hypothetical protein